MYKKYHGKNGLTTITSRMPQMSSVSLGVWIGIGGRYEKPAESGISHLVEHMLFKGTNTRTAKDLKEQIEGVGGAFNGFTSDEATCYMVKVPAKYTKLGVDVLTDMVMDARFDEADLVKEKFVVCEEIKMYHDQPAERVLDMLGEIMWPGNALGRPLTGSSATVKGFSRRELINFRDNNYHPANIAVIATGKINPEVISKYAQEKFSNIKKKKKPSFKLATVAQKSAHMKFSRGNTQQTHIALGFHAPAKNTRERFAMKIMNVILGGNMSSRLFEELREKYGLCYDISSSYKRHSDVGEVHIHAGVDNAKAEKSVLAIMDELKKLRDIGVTKDELTRAKEYTKGQFLLAMEGTSTRMLWLGDRSVVHGQIPEVKNVVQKIDEVTAKDIQKVCEEVFISRAVNLAMIGKLTDKSRARIKRELIKL